MYENSSRHTFLSIYLNFYLPIYIFSALSRLSLPELCRLTRPHGGKAAKRRRSCRLEFE
jgi:hypothetical protein